MISLDRTGTLLHYTLDEILMAPQGRLVEWDFPFHEALSAACSGGDSHASCF